MICLTKFVLNSIILFISQPVEDIKHFAKFLVDVTFKFIHKVARSASSVRIRLSTKNSTGCLHEPPEAPTNKRLKITQMSCVQLFVTIALLVIFKVH